VDDEFHFWFLRLTIPFTKHVQESESPSALLCYYQRTNLKATYSTLRIPTPLKK